jgi:hypothetical protein
LVALFLFFTQQNSPGPKLSRFADRLIGGHPSFIACCLLKYDMQECARQNLSRRQGAFMRRKLIALLLICAAHLGCQRATPTPATPPQVAQEGGTPSSSPANSPTQPATAATTVVKPRLDACALLTDSEIQSVQGEAIKETKLTGQLTGGLVISQCFFTLPTFNKSISLIVAHKGDGAGAREPQEFWRTTFHAARKEDKARKKSEEESDPPKKISGLGDEAFWMGNRIAGALYVLKGDAYVRVSVGGPSDKASQTRARTLAQKALARL